MQRKKKKGAREGWDVNVSCLDAFFEGREMIKCDLKWYHRYPLKAIFYFPLRSNI